VEIPYKGTADGTLAVMSGTADFQFIMLDDNSLNLTRQGKLKMLAVATESRVKDHPELPAINEFVPGFVILSWTRIAAHGKTPAPIIDFLFKEFTFALKQPDVIQKMGVVGRFAAPSASTADFSRQLKEETDLYIRGAKAAGIVPKPLQ